MTCITYVIQKLRERERRLKTYKYRKHHPDGSATDHKTLKDARAEPLHLDPIQTFFGMEKHHD
jgi:molybdopterin-guanine dinucleotide biosynthesis protein